MLVKRLPDDLVVLRRHAVEHADFQSSLDIATPLQSGEQGQQAPSGVITVASCSCAWDWLRSLAAQTITLSGSSLLLAKTASLLYLTETP